MVLCDPDSGIMEELPLDDLLNGPPTWTGTQGTFTIAKPSTTPTKAPIKALPPSTSPLPLLKSPPHSPERRRTRPRHK